MEHAADPAGSLHDFAERLPFNVTQIACNQKLRFHLQQGTARLPEKVAEVFLGKPALAFGNVAGHGHRRPA
jgi:hypothetical protein